MRVQLLRSRLTATVLASTLAALSASIYFAAAPVYTFSGSVQSFNAEGVRSSVAYAGTSRSLAQVNGPRAYLLLLLSVILAALPLFVQRSRPSPAVGALSALLLLGFVLATGFSIGYAYTPALLLALTGAAFSFRARSSRSRSA